MRPRQPPARKRNVTKAKRSLSGLDFEGLKTFAKSITSEQKNARDAEVAKQLHRLLYRCAFHPNFRAYQLVRASKLSFISDFSHHFEAAHAHYCRGEYLSAVLTFVPAIEGVLRAHARETIADVMRVKAAHLNEGRPQTEWVELDESDAVIPDLIGALRARPVPNKETHTHDHWRRSLNRDFLCDMLTDWLFCPIAEAEERGNFAITYLNRNGIQHAFRADCYYTQADVGRLFLVMDMMRRARRQPIPILKCLTSFIWATTRTAISSSTVKTVSSTSSNSRSLRTAAARWRTSA
ncbi:MAG: hypothetical protein WB810_11635 [Candidatus Cybelea sp.]